ncbi:PapD-like protein [Syncephalis fuscata]|nr:PapD-like protein [Syncephalis fuscata]
MFGHRLIYTLYLGPFNQMVKEVLLIHNPSTSPVAFKVKTTTPKQYCVRPNAGRIEPGETVDVQGKHITTANLSYLLLVLQPMREDPPPDFRCKDKFLVQSVAIPADRDRLPISELWQLMERENRSEMTERKLRCAFLMPPESRNEGGSAAAAAAAAGDGEDASLLASDPALQRPSVSYIEVAE